MSYTIGVRVIQTKPKDWYSIVEQTVNEAGTWTECDRENILTIFHSGCSGMLRFKNANGENFLVALGIHNYKRWCDIVTDLDNNTTGVMINPQYYTGDRGDMLWKQLSKLERTNCNGEKIKVDYYVDEGYALKATITIS